MYNICNPDISYRMLLLPLALSSVMSVTCSYSYFDLHCFSFSGYFSFCFPFYKSFNASAAVSVFLNLNPRKSLSEAFHGQISGSSSL